MKNHWTKKECDMIINLYRKETAYFGENNEILGEIRLLKYGELFSMFQNKGFGYAETQTIIACLIKCGAKIID